MVVWVLGNKLVQLLAYRAYGLLPRVRVRRLGSDEPVGHQRVQFPAKLLLSF